MDRVQKAGANPWNTVMNLEDDTLKPPYDAQFPFYQAWQTAYKNTDIFAKSDGVTQYSKEYWDLWHQGEMDTASAMHETLAEMLRIKYMTGKFPDHHLGSARRGEKASSAEITKGALAWRKFFKVVNG